MKQLMIKTFLMVIVFASLTLAQSTAEINKLLIYEKNQEALNKANEWVTKQPKKAEAYYSLGNSYIALNELDKAKETFNKGIQVDDDNALNYVGLGKVALLNEQETEAEAQFAKALDIDDENADVLVELGEAYNIKAQKYGAKGIESLKKAKQLYDRKKKKNVKLFLTLGDIYKAQNNAQEANNNYNEAINVDPELPYPTLMKAQIYENVNQDAAAQNYQEVLKKDPNFAPALRALSNLYYNKKDYPQSADYYEKYIQASGTDPEKQKRLASIYYVNKQYDKATTILSNVLTQAPNDPVALRLISNVYMDANDSLNAITNFEKYFQIQDPAKVTSGDYEKYAGVLGQLKKDSLAALNYEKAFKLDTTKVDLLSNIADSYFRQKNYPKVIEILNTKLAADSGSATLIDYRYLGMAYYFDTTIVNNYQKSADVFSTLVAKKSDYVQGWLWLARSYNAIDLSGEQKLAKAPYEKLAALVLSDPANASTVNKNKKELVESYIVLGYIHMQTDKPLAIEYYNKVIALDPANTTAIAALQELQASNGNKKGKK